MNDADFDNISDAITYLRDKWDRQLKEEYQLGLEDGRGHYTQARADGYEEGYTAGYNTAIKKIYALAKETFSGPETDVAPEPEPEPIIVEAPTLAATVPPGLQRALEYVREHPGTNSSQAYPHIKNNSALYTLAKRGLIEKRGPQFYPKDVS